jgi:hypothetical protein
MICILQFYSVCGNIAGTKRLSITLILGAQAYKLAVSSGLRIMHDLLVIIGLILERGSALFGLATLRELLISPVHKMGMNGLP